MDQISNLHVTPVQEANSKACNNDWSMQAVYLSSAAVSLTPRGSQCIQSKGREASEKKVSEKMVSLSWFV